MKVKVFGALVASQAVFVILYLAGGGAVVPFVVGMAVFLTLASWIIKGGMT